ncbi:hypothetical protein BGW36DRAFT_365484 [Talaromyces proteolyticus]|uniref:BZIP domain-containing protein n=1 Tax=Talaromyces proteolyticus TaxID=1131652 RepID=A0AAD4KGG5_9EURO|nr:uncharacterized protein BGW36DRAFT_365484 [Talaromyces proteolyticus]KAH8688947.1 hypothetical protein BGW36DRAFT_365484 [Talaromyces proteolyticus]
MNFKQQTDYKDRGLLSNPTCRPSEGKGITDDWTCIEARKERKKVQNRLNQRAHRRRISEKTTQNSTIGRHPYRVDRWRIRDFNVSQLEDTAWNSTNELDTRTSSYSNLRSAIQPSPGSGNSHQRSDLVATSVKSDGSHRTQFPLPSDHLLHLIHYNVFRALVSNKKVLKLFAKTIAQSNDIDNPHRGRRLCDGPTIIHPFHTGLPSSLFPTPLQMIHPHSNWIDMFPFPQIRDNLIKWEGYFDVLDFLRDIFGDIVNNNLSITSDTCESSSTSTQMLLQGEDDDMITAGRKGLIVWGEAHQKENWEATPGFLKKWNWVLEGCEELIEMSNRWREIRGEEPIKVIVGSVRTPISGN